jgi:hypothetical protein
MSHLYRTFMASLEAHKIRTALRELAQPEADGSGGLHMCEPYIAAMALEDDRVKAGLVMAGLRDEITMGIDADEYAYGSTGWQMENCPGRDK